MFTQEWPRGIAGDRNRLPPDTDVNPRVAQRVGVFLGDHLEELELDLGIGPVKGLQRGRQMLYIEEGVNPIASQPRIPRPISRVPS